MMHCAHVVGARPNFMKVAPVMAALAAHSVTQTLIHTGQHYDRNMSDVFFRDLEIPEPDINLEVGSGTHTQQTAEVMTRLEPRLGELGPDVVIVYGDVNSTLAAALVCARLRLPVAHVEAGLRSFDRTMPEEVNRLLTDQIADWLFTPSVDADANLLREGRPASSIHLVGNVMIDTLVRLLPVADRRWEDGPRQEWSGGPYALVTLHRPSNVDDPDALAALMRALADISRDIPLVFPVHPRTRERIRKGELDSASDTLHMVAPLSYIDFLAFERHAAMAITDSGGVQEETTYLGIPCLTLRPNTERPVTVTMGTNTIVGHDTTRLRHEVRRVLDEGGNRRQVPPLWDGHASERIAAVLAEP
jgi:UDP-N-acetylglucosamine 2-epimerase (non-hydrolysing)